MTTGFLVIYKLKTCKILRWFNIGCACNVRSKFARAKGENFTHSWFRLYSAFPWHLNGIIYEFNANLNEFKVTYSVDDRQICLLKHKEMFSKVTFWNRWNYLLINIKFDGVISLYLYLNFYFVEYLTLIKKIWIVISFDL